MFVALKTCFLPLFYIGGFACSFYLLSFLKSLRLRVFFSFLFFFLLSLYQLSWLSCSTYHGKSIWMIWIFISVIYAAQYSFLILFVFYDSFLSVLRSYQLSCFWVIGEYIRLKMFSGIPFFPLGEFFCCSIYHVQSASLAGVHGLSFLFLFSSLLLFSSFKYKKNSHYYCFGIVYLSMICYGVYRISIDKKMSITSHDKISASLVQTGWLPEQKHDLQGFEGECLSPYQMWKEMFVLLKNNDAKNIDLIIFPESTVPMGAYEEVYSSRILNEVFNDELSFSKQEFVSNLTITQQMSCYFNTPILIGLDFFDDAASSLKNSAFLINPINDQIEVYSKNILVPFGEYLPFFWLRNIAKKYGLSTFFAKGEAPIRLQGKYLMAPSICYEEYFSKFIRKQASGKADFLVNLTNDGWFYPSLLVENHLTHAKLRSIENGLFTFRASNTGETAVISPIGNEIGRLSCKDKKRLQGVLFVDVNLYRVDSIFSRFGEIPFILFLGISFFSCLLPTDRERKFFFFGKKC